MIESAEEFARLRRSGEPEEQMRASHEEAPLSVWLDVIARYPDLREWAAHNKTIPLEVLGRLSHDPDPKVRFVVATKRKLTAELRQHLAADIDASVRARVALNPKCDADTLRMLLSDPDCLVREAARERLAQNGDDA